MQSWLLSINRLPPAIISIIDGDRKSDASRIYAHLGVYVEREHLPLSPLNF